MMMDEMERFKSISNFLELCCKADLIKREDLTKYVEMTERVDFEEGKLYEILRQVFKDKRILYLWYFIVKREKKEIFSG